MYEYWRPLSGGNNREVPPTEQRTIYIHDKYPCPLSPVYVTTQRHSQTSSPANIIDENGGYKLTYFVRLPYVVGASIVPATRFAKFRNGRLALW